MAGDTASLEDAYDTDTISLTSTVSDEYNEYRIWDVEDIVAEGYEDGRKMWLIKWEGFGWEEATWEPVENIEGSQLLEIWETKKKTFASEELEEYMKDNESRRIFAIEKAEAERILRKQKRAKRREKLRPKSAGNSPREESESDDDVPLIRGRRQVTNAQRTSRESNEDGTSLAKKPGKPRKPPLEQSSSSDSDSSVDQASAELLVMDIAEEGKRQSLLQLISSTTNKEQAHSKDSASALSSKQRSGRLTPQEQTQKPLKAIAVASTSQDRTSKDQANGGKAALQSSRPQTSTASSKEIPRVPARSARRISNSESLPSSTATSAKPAMASIKRSAPGATPGPIKIVNHAPIETRKPRQNSDKLYNTLSKRGNAEKRSRAEKAPDPGALIFVNGAPAGITKTPAVQEKTPKPPIDNLYGRRELVHPRVQEEDPDDHGEERRKESLAEWEDNKAPLTCWEWRNNSCRRKAEECRFLHRNGWPMAPVDGKMPPKYGRPPLTCPYYMENRCRKSADECTFAHHNTGWGPDQNGKPERIDPDRLPRSERESFLPKHQDPPITCFFWMRGDVGCNRSDEGCKYAHYNTGYMGAFPKDWKGDPGKAIETIPLDWRPKFERRLSISASQHNSQIVHPLRTSRKDKTCYFWNQGHCSKTEAACDFAHRHLEEIAGPPAHHIEQQLPSLGTSSGSTMLLDSSAFPSQPSTHKVASTGLKGPPQKALARPSAYGDDGIDDSGIDIGALNGPAPPPPMHPLAKISSKTMKMRIENACNLHFATIFCSNLDKNVYLDRRAFLVFHPQDHMEETELITRWLLMHHVEVCGLWIDGSWNYFKQALLDGASGVVLVHPEFCAFDGIPDFGKLLRTNLRVWSIGYQAPASYDPLVTHGQDPPEYCCVELFPHGGIIYITDEVFIQTPFEAYKIVTWFLGKVAKCQPCNGLQEQREESSCDNHGPPLLWRLATQPELMKMMWEWLVAHAADLEANEPVATCRANLYQLLLLESGCVDSEEHRDFLVRPDQVDYWPIMSERQEHVDEYYAALEQGNQVEANRQQVKLYSEMMIDQARDYRHYFVVHTEPDRVDWHEQWQHIEEIMTPEKCVEYIQQPAKGNRFDFFDWAYLEKT